MHTQLPAQAKDADCGCTGQTAVPSDQASCGCEKCCDGCRASRWAVGADVLWLERSGGNGVTLGRTFNVATGDTVDTLSGRDAGYSMQAGGRFRLLYQPDDCTAWEAVYFGMQTWSGGSSVTPDLFVAGTLADSPWPQTDKLVVGFDQSLAFHSTSRLNNVEINRRRELGGNDCASIHWLVGLRYVQWDESFALDGLNSLPAAFEEIGVLCHNQMVGPQIGGNLRRTWNRWQLAVEEKAGLLADTFQQRRSNLNSSGVQPGAFPAITPIDDANHGSGAAGIIDFSFLATYQLTPYLAARGGYQLLYLSGLAHAPAQLGGFDNSGTVFPHGPTLGLEMNW